MDQILVWNAQNRFRFWGSASDPAGRAYDAPPDPLVVKGFLLSSIAASSLWHSQFELLSRSHKHPQLLDLKFFPLQAPLVQFCGADELWILLYMYIILCPHPIYVLGPSLISWILLLIKTSFIYYFFDLIAKKYEINISKNVRRSPRPPSREGLLAFGNRSFAPSGLALFQIFSRSVPPKVRYRFSPLLQEIQVSCIRLTVLITIGQCDIEYGNNLAQIPRSASVVGFSHKIRYHDNSYTDF